MKYQPLMKMAALAFGVAALPALASAQASPSPSPSPGAMSKPAASPGVSPAPSPSPAASPTPVPHVYQLSGYVDAALASVGGTDAVRFVPTSPTAIGAPSHIFDGSNGPFFDLNGGKQLGGPNDFNATPNLQNFDLTLAINPTGTLGGKIETIVGSDADFLASNGQTRGKFTLAQAYFQYASGPLTFLAGKMDGLAGYELANTISNTNFSRDYLYGAVMSTETGLRATYAYNPKFSLTVGANNGWDDWKFDGKKKTLEGSLAITPSPGYSLNLTTYNGNDFLAGGLSGTGLTKVLPVYTNRMLYDEILTVHATSALTIVANADNGTQLNLGGPSYHWAGIAGYANYQFNPMYALSLRKETYRDSAGFRTGAGVPIRIQSNTATVTFTPTSNYIFRAEYRLDAADANAFQFRHLGNPPGDILTGRSKQSEFALEAVYKLP